MKHRFFALLCALALLVSTLPSALALEGESARAADLLSALQIVRGEYALTAPATNANAAVLLVRLSGGEHAAQATAVTPRSPYYTAPAYARASIAYAASQGWITSLTAQSFRPEDAVTANDWCAMLLRMLGYGADDFSPSDAAVFAQRIGLLAQPLSGTLSRGQLFETIRDALTFPYRDGSATVIQHLIDCGAVSSATARALGLLSPTLNARQIADRYLSAVFRLDQYETTKDITEKTPSGNASGFFISKDGLAATNYHAIDGSIHATVTLSTGETFPVESVVWYSPDMDLAVLRVSKTSTEGKTVSAFACLDIVGTADIHSGDTVYTLGNPLGLGLAVSSGIISATARNVERYTLPCVMNTADISKGSSGGALLNEYGHVVAVTSGAFTYGNNMYLAVPADPLMTVDAAPGHTLAQVVEIESAKKDAATPAA